MVEDVCAGCRCEDDFDAPGCGSVRAVVVVWPWAFLAMPVVGFAALGGGLVTSFLFIVFIRFSFVLWWFLAVHAVVVVNTVRAGGLMSYIIASSVCSFRAMSKICLKSST